MKFAKINKNIIDKPIVLNVYSQTCPDLTLALYPELQEFRSGTNQKILNKLQKIWQEDILKIL